jgi:hypothetical protein
MSVFIGSKYQTIKRLQLSFQYGAQQEPQLESSFEYKQ